jgi:hypothetical protein
VRFTFTPLLLERDTRGKIEKLLARAKGRRLLAVAVNRGTHRRPTRTPVLDFNRQSCGRSATPPPSSRGKAAAKREHRRGRVIGEGDRPAQRQANRVGARAAKLVLLTFTSLRFRVSLNAARAPAWLGSASRSIRSKTSPSFKPPFGTRHVQKFRWDRTGSCS